MNDFPKEEFANRISKIQENLEKESLQAVIITSPSNFRYFSGLDSNFWESPTRPWFLVISQKNWIKAIVPSIGMKVIEKTTDGIWYETSDGTECYLTNEEVDMMLEMLHTRLTARWINSEQREKTNDR